MTPAPAHVSEPAGPALQVLTTGVAGSVRGPGRHGAAHLGRSRGGALDLMSLELANRLVGNHPNASGIETSGGVALVAHRPVLVAVTGARASIEVRGGTAIGWGAPAVLEAGSTLRITRLHDGARCYLSVRGGLLAPEGPLGAGQALDIGPDPRTPASTEVAVPRPVATTVRIWPGPRLDWFGPSAWSTLVGSSWKVLPAGDRRGLRLGGPVLERMRHGELPPEGIVEGAVQMPPDGSLIVMLADHPVTGGYPVVAVIDPADLTHVAQWVPGTIARLVPTTAHPAER